VASLHDEARLLAVLHVKADVLKEGAHYNVNLKTKKLVELPGPKRPRPKTRAGRQTRAAKKTK
jgi:hypothetical protein